MKKKKRRSRKQLYDRHHIIPSSRQDEIHISFPERNIVKVDRKRHNLYHRLFSNKTPQEIINLLVDEFWGKQRYWVYKTIYQWDVDPIGGKKNGKR